MLAKLLTRPTSHLGAMYSRAGELEGWRAGGLEGWRAGGLESWRTAELVSCRAGQLESWRAGELRAGGLESCRAGERQGCVRAGCTGLHAVDEADGRTPGTCHGVILVLRPQYICA